RLVERLDAPTRISGLCSSRPQLVRDFSLLICCRCSAEKFLMQLKIAEVCDARLLECGASATLQIAAAYRLPPSCGCADRRSQTTLDPMLLDCNADALYVRLRRGINRCVARAKVGWRR